MVHVHRIVRPLLLCLLLFLGTPAVVGAVGQASSPGYSVDNVTFGSGSQQQACGTIYCADQSAGDLAVGEQCSPGFCVQVGSQTERQPYLEFLVNNTNIDLGVLSTSTTKVASATFAIKTYLASGYTVVNASPAPTNGSYVLNALSSPTASTTGTEQFGINLVANSCPANTPTSGAGSCSGGFGAAPVQVPDSTFSFGKVADNTVNTPSTDRYDQPNLFMYKNGDIVAFSTKSSGETDYTISYLFNIKDVTAGGTFTMNHVLVATSTF